MLRNGKFEVQVTGVRKLGDPTTVTAEDLWHHGSTTKTMTSTLLALLIEESHLTWQSTISEALPAWKDRMLEEHVNTTLAMLGAHRGGLTEDWATQTDEFPFAFFKNLRDYSSVEGRTLVIDFALTRPPIFRPGTQFSYSNTGFMLLGYIIEQMSGTGESWDELMHRRLFKPLGMDQECRIGISLDTSLPPTNPWPHLQKRNSSKIIPIAPDKCGDIPLAMGPAGLAFCSLNSYSKFLRFHLDGYKGRPSAANITLSESSFRILHTPWPGDTYSSGAWGIAHVEGAGHVLKHAGSNGLNYFQVYLAPDVEGAFVAATNMVSPNATQEVIDSLIQGRLPM